MYLSCGAVSVRTGHALLQEQTGPPSQWFTKGLFLPQVTCSLWEGTGCRANSSLLLCGLGLAERGTHAPTFTEQWEGSVADGALALQLPLITETHEPYAHILLAKASMAMGNFKGGSGKVQSYQVPDKGLGGHH